MNIQDKFKYLKNQCIEAIAEHPELKEEIKDIYNLCMSECEDSSSSASHEIDLALNSLDDLLEENKPSDDRTEWETEFEREL